MLIRTIINTVLKGEFFNFMSTSQETFYVVTIFQFYWVLKGDKILKGQEDELERYLNISFTICIHKF